MEILPNTSCVPNSFQLIWEYSHITKSREPTQNFGSLQKIPIICYERDLMVAPKLEKPWKSITFQRKKALREDFIHTAQ